MSAPEVFEIIRTVLTLIVLGLGVFCLAGATFVFSLVVWGYCAQIRRQRKLKRAADILREIRKDGGR